MTKGLIGIGESVHASIPRYGKVMRQLFQRGPGAYDQPSNELNLIKDLILDFYFVLGNFGQLSGLISDNFS